MSFLKNLNIKTKLMGISVIYIVCMIILGGYAYKTIHSLSEGKAYVDFVAGIAVNALGYGDPELTEAFNQAAAQGVIHVSNLYHSAPQAELAALLTDLSKRG